MQSIYELADQIATEYRGDLSIGRTEELRRFVESALEGVARNPTEIARCLSEVVNRLDTQTDILTDIHAACCEDPDEDSPSPLIEELREMRASIDRQTRALDALAAALSGRGAI